MEGIGLQILGESIGAAITDVKARVSSKSSKTAPMLSMQVLLPFEQWDWPTDPTGTSSSQLYLFCSKMPASCLTNIRYKSGAKFSDMYKMFLSCLVDDSLIENALKDFDNEKYYTQVFYNQSQTTPEPAWNISEFPTEWISENYNTPPSRQSIQVKMDDLAEAPASRSGETIFAIGDDMSKETPLPLNKGDCQTFEIIAKAFGHILITAGDWYSDALLEVKAKGPYKPGYSGSKSLATSTTDTWFFGEGGLISGLLTGIYVAIDPEIKTIVSHSFAEKINKELDKNAEIRIGGIYSNKKEINIKPLPDDKKFVEISLPIFSTTSNSTPKAVIIGASVRQLGVQL